MNKRYDFKNSTNIFSKSFFSLPAIFKLKATPTPHIPLFALPDDAPAQRVP